MRASMEKEGGEEDSIAPLPVTFTNVFFLGTFPISLYMIERHGLEVVVLKEEKLSDNLFCTRGPALHLDLFYMPKNYTVTN